MTGISPDNSNLLSNPLHPRPRAGTFSCQGPWDICNITHRPHQTISLEMSCSVCQTLINSPRMPCQGQAKRCCRPHPQAGCPQPALGNSTQLDCSHMSAFFFAWRHLWVGFLTFSSASSHLTHHDPGTYHLTHSLDCILTLILLSASTLLVAIQNDLSFSLHAAWPYIFKNYLQWEGELFI